MKTCFSKKEIDIIREIMFVGITAHGVDIYLEPRDFVRNRWGERAIESLNKVLHHNNAHNLLVANKILYKLGFDGINKDGTDKDEDYDN